MMTELYVRIYNWLHKDDGQGMVEYGLILALIAVVVIGALYVLGGKISGIFEGVNNTISESL